MCRYSIRIIGLNNEQTRELVSAKSRTASTHYRITEIPPGIEQPFARTRAGDCLYLVSG